MPTVRIDISSPHTNATIGAAGDVTDEEVLGKLRDVLDHLQTASYQQAPSGNP